MCADEEGNGLGDVDVPRLLGVTPFWFWFLDKTHQTTMVASRRRARVVAES